MKTYEKIFVGNLQVNEKQPAMRLVEEEYLVRKKRAKTIHLNLSPANTRRQGLCFATFIEKDNFDKDRHW